eukprot:scaffold33528_cov84-Skeletonema_dohrnii-CCMP3373.AAC.1
MPSKSAEHGHVRDGDRTYRGKWYSKTNDANSDTESAALRSLTRTQRTESPSTGIARGGDKNIDEMSQIRDKRLPTSHVQSISAAPEATPLALRSIARHRIVEFG